MLLRAIDLFADIDDESLSKLSQSARVVSFRKNSVLMSEGESGEALYVIKNGTVKIFVSDEEGNEIVLNDLGPGSYFGEVSLLDGEPRTASAIALQNTQILVIPKITFIDCIEQNPQITTVIVRTITQRLRRATVTIRSLALENVYQRLAAKLMELSEPTENYLALPRKYSNYELATMIGASREMVGKLLNDLVAGDYIEKRQNRWYILKDLPTNW